VITGRLIRKLIRAAASRSKPIRRAAVMVMPDRDVPGLSASACAAPMNRASRMPMWSIVRVPRCWSAHHSRSPNPISDTAMIHGSPSTVSICSSNTAPTRAAGTVATTSSQAILPSGVVGRSRLQSSRNPSRTYTTMSRRKYDTTATSVPAWSATSNDFFSSSGFGASANESHSNNHGTRMR
jgi:hypothetical protein